MRASIRRIDLTQTPAEVDVWPSIDWLTEDVETVVPSAPRGRGGLWDAMASAVARAREASATEDFGDGAGVIDLAVEAPHLAYLARVACDNQRDDEDIADVIDFDGLRARDRR
jgi:hypothetical protein